jgi:IS1 family transposase
MSQNASFLDSLLKSDLSKHATIFANKNKYKLHILYTKINRDEKNVPHFETNSVHANNSYVYPASTVKLPIALMALLKLEETNLSQLNRATTMITDSAFYCQKSIKVDSSSSNGLPSIENYIKKMFLVSDNSSCARVYEYAGYDYLHKKLAELNFKNVRLFNRLDSQCQGDTSKITPPIYFLNAAKDTIVKQSLTYAIEKLNHPIRNSLVGSFHLDANGKLVKGPKDFSNHNYFQPTDLHKLMLQLVFSNHALDTNKLPITNENRFFMLQQLGLYPKESNFPKYDKKIFYDSYKKYFLYGSSVAAINQDSIRVINIVGRAYGFLIDCAYIIDFKNNIEFLLTACIYVNKSNKVGRGKYEYDSIGLPFLKDLGWCMYNYERKRVKKILPDLSEFKVLFEKK